MEYKRRMIFDRTISDVVDATSIRKNKVQSSVALTDAEVNILERGTITINTLNRIESKQAEIKEDLKEMGYFDAPIANKTWDYFGVFTEEDFERIVENNAVLRRAFYALKDSPLNAMAKYHYAEINALEKILFDISSNIVYTIDRYRACGDFECGGI